jgi:O-antigen/teichoic acid export membrane protein
VPTRLAPRTDGFATNVLRTFATIGLARPMQVFTGILTARLLGPYDRGLYTLLLMIPYTLEGLLKLGVAPANVYMICRGKANTGQVVSNSVLLAFGLGSLAFLLLPFHERLGAALLGNVGGWYLLLAVSLVPFYLLSTYLTSVLYALNRFRTANWRTLVAAAGRLAGTFVVLVVFQRGLLEAFLVNVAIGVAIAVWLLATVFAHTSPTFRPHLGTASATLTFGLKSHAQTLITSLHLRLDLFLIAFFLGPQQVAFYAIATHIAEVLGDIHRPVSIVLYPRLAAAGDARIHETTMTSCRHVFFLELAAALTLVLSAQFLVGFLYGPDYLPAVRPLLVIVPGVVMLSVFNLLTRNFMSRNKQHTTIAAGLVGLIMNVALNLFLIPVLGITGAALASTLSYSLATFVLLLSFRRDSGIALRELVHVRKSDLEFYRKLPGKLRVRSATS